MTSRRGRQSGGYRRSYAPPTGTTRFFTYGVASSIAADPPSPRLRRGKHNRHHLFGCMHHKRLMINVGQTWSSRKPRSTPRNYNAAHKAAAKMLMPMMHRKPLMMSLKTRCLRKFEFFAIARRLRLPSLQRGALRFPDGDHLFRVRTCELTSAGETAAPAQSSQDTHELAFQLQS